MFFIEITNILKMYNQYKYFTYQGDIYYLKEIREYENIGILEKVYNRTCNYNSNIKCFDLDFIYDELHETLLWGY